MDPFRSFTLAIQSYLKVAQCPAELKAARDQIIRMGNQNKALEEKFDARYAMTPEEWLALTDEKQAKAIISSIDPDRFGSSLFRLYRELREHHRLVGIVTAPLDVPAYQSWFAEWVAPNIRKNAGFSKWRQFEDKSYRTIYYADLERIVQHTWVPDFTYESDITDCDWFVREFKNELESNYHCNSAAQVSTNYNGKGHKILSVFCIDIPAIVDITRARVVRRHDQAVLPVQLDPKHWLDYDG